VGQTKLPKSNSFEISLQIAVEVDPACVRLTRLLDGRLIWRCDLPSADPQRQRPGFIGRVIEQWAY
jgi:hypothetical protein